MQDKYFSRIAEELEISSKQVSATAQLLEEGGTIPFIARYRKERTGSLDEVAIQGIRDKLEKYAEFDKRRDTITKSLQERELLNDALNARLADARSLSELEDIYLPYRPKKRTRGTIAREKGLERLAQTLLKQETTCNPEQEARAFISEEKGVSNTEEALTGARDIIAEIINEDTSVRQTLRNLFTSESTLVSKITKDKEKDGLKFKDYFDWQEPSAKAASHRLLAIFRGENEGFLKVSIAPDSEKAVKLTTAIYRKNFCKAWEHVRQALEDSYKRLLAPSLENEYRKLLREKAEEKAIKVFSDNLRELLMAPPLGQKSVIAIDPGFRTGCKVVCLDPQGKLLEHSVIFISQSEQARQASIRNIKQLVAKHNTQAICIGNGTGSRETESFIRSIGFPASLDIVMVNESGASIYSASEVAREEFPDYDVTVRGAVSIGRRLMDPLAELVKIDAKSIGVGQYQHDVDQGKLKKSLDDTVTSCVNQIGVEVNTASKQLLSYVAGLGSQLAANIVSYRDENGPFKNRKQLKKVPRLGPKAFEQAAGFLRIRNSDNPLDKSAVHPESYLIVEKMSSDQQCSVEELLASPETRRKIILEKYITDKIGMPTLNDIMKELAKPGLDPRQIFAAFAFAEGVNEIKDLQPGMTLPGIVTNVTQFGAFVDIGVHQDGLVHISQLSDKFIKDPADIVKVNQQVLVRVLEVDQERKRIALSMKSEKVRQKW